MGYDGVKWKWNFFNVPRWSRKCVSWGICSSTWVLSSGTPPERAASLAVSPFPVIIGFFPFMVLTFFISFSFECRPMEPAVTSSSSRVTSNACKSSPTAAMAVCKSPVSTAPRTPVRSPPATDPRCIFMSRPRCSIGPVRIVWTTSGWRRRCCTATRSSPRWLGIKKVRFSWLIDWLIFSFLGRLIDWLCIRYLVFLTKK